MKRPSRPSCVGWRRRWFASWSRPGRPLTTPVGTDWCPPYSARIAFDRVLASAKIFPAIDPSSSHSTAASRTPASSHSTAASRTPEHIRRSDEARALLAAGRVFDPHSQGRGQALGRELRAAERDLLTRAHKLQAFLTTESFVAASGKTLSLEATLFGVGDIIDGRCDDIEAVHFLYKGDLDEVRRVAGES